MVLNDWSGIIDYEIQYLFIYVTNFTLDTEDQDMFVSSTQFGN